MKNIIETLGITVGELIGIAAVIVALSGAIVLFRAFGDTFISYFI